MTLFFYPIVVRVILSRVDHVWDSLFSLWDFFNIGWFHYVVGLRLLRRKLLNMLKGMLGKAVHVPKKTFEQKMIELDR